MVNNKLKYNVVANFVGQIYTMAIGVLILPLYLKYLGSEQYGLIAFFTMLTSLMMLLDAGITPTITRESARESQNKVGLKSTLRVVELIIFPLIIFSSGVVVFFSDRIANHWINFKEIPSDDVITCIKCMALIASLRWAITIYKGVLMGLEQQVWVNVYNTASTTMRTIIILFIIVQFKVDIVFYFLYQIVLSCIELFIVYIKLLKETGFKTKSYPTVKILKRIFPFLLSTGFTTLSWSLFVQSDKILLSGILPLDEYGYYIIVVAVSGVIMKFSTPFTQAILPRMTSLVSRGKDNEMLYIYRKSSRTVAFLVCPISGMISLYSTELLYAWSGDLDFASWGGAILQLYVLGTAMIAINSFQYYIQYAVGNLSFHVKYNFYLPLVGIPTLYFFVKEFGALGAAYSLLVIQCLTFIFWNKKVHDYFYQGLHIKWVLVDILPYVLTTSICLLIYHKIKIDLIGLEPFSILLCLVSLGIIVLIINLLVYKITDIKGE